MYNLLDYSNKPDLWNLSGERIRERREQLGYTQDSLAEKISEYSRCDRQNVIKWENGKAPINKLIQLGAVCQILECDPEYITCQCDTLRKEYSDPVSRFGLSEDTLGFLEEAETVHRNEIEEWNTYFASTPIEYEKCDSANVIDFIIDNRSILTALKTLLHLTGTSGSRIDLSGFNFKANGNIEKAIKNGGLIASVLNEKTVFHSPLELYRDNKNQFVVTKEQAAYIAEQQLIAEIRKALEK